MRAAFLRFLILGGDERYRPHEKGVRVSGGWISGVLDLEGCRVPRDIGLKDCRFDSVPVLRYRGDRQPLSRRLLAFPASRPSGWRRAAEYRSRARSWTGEVRLSGSRLGGNLSLDGAAISCAGGAALVADAIEVQIGGTARRRDLRARHA